MILALEYVNEDAEYEVVEIGPRGFVRRYISEAQIGISDPKPHTVLITRFEEQTLTDNEIRNYYRHVGEVGSDDKESWQIVEDLVEDAKEFYEHTLGLMVEQGYNVNSGN